MASLVHMERQHRVNNLEKNINFEGLIMQSLDVLDFSMIHLSTYERIHKKFQKRLWPHVKRGSEMKKLWENITAVKVATNYISKTVPKMKYDWSPEAKRTIVIMPFLGGAMGAGHSVLAHRYVYLVACFWSIYRFLPNIIVSVASETDAEWARNKSGLPFYDVFVMKNLPKSAALPVATTQEARRRIIDGRLDFDYIFYTESDQILLWRLQSYIYDYLKSFPTHVVTPHRLMAYSKLVLRDIHRRSLPTNYASRDEDLQESLPAWQNMSCCLPRQNCNTRKHWVHLKNPKVPILTYLGIEIPLGNANFLDEIYRYCSLTPNRIDICP